MKLGLLSTCCLALMATAAYGQSANERIPGGPAAGMLFGKAVVTSGDMQLVSLQPSLPDASPVPAELRAPVDALLAADHDKDLTHLKGVLAEGAVTRFCPLDHGVVCEPDRPFDGFGLPGKDRANTPYYMPDGRVRVEWLAGSDVRFMSFLVFANGKLTRVETTPALMPVKKNG